MEIILEFEETMRFTSNWYREYYLEKNIDMFNYSLKQIELYVELANKEILIGQNKFMEHTINGLLVTKLNTFNSEGGNLLG